MRLSKLKKTGRAALLSFTALALTLGTSMAALAAVQNPAPSAKVSFTFDDGLESIYTQAAPTLAKYGLTGTNYVVTGCVGMNTAPNTCHANTDAKYMTWAQVQAVQNSYGWEIGSHTATHPYLASSDAGDGQPNVLTPAQVANEMTTSKAAFTAHGINATDFASPYGDYNNNVLAEVAKVYESHRGFADQNNNIWSYNDMILNNMQVQAGVSVAQVKARIDQAIANKEWLILTFHDIKTNPSTDPGDYEYKTSDLDQIAAYAKAKASQIKTVNIRDGLVKSDVNAMPNGDLARGMADGWSTNNATAVKADNGNHGSYPESTNAMYLSSGNSTNFLFSPKVAVDSSQTYMFKSFLNMMTRTSGELGYYIDEYDANGNWVSGQWKTAENTPFVETMNFTYTPSSANVKKASLQIYVTANSGITAYVDNFQMFNLTGTTTPAPAPVTLTDIMTNGTFDNGIASGWTTTNSTNFVSDNGNHGSSANPANAIKLTAGSSNAHLFSPRLSVVSGTEYTVNAFTNLVTRSSSELGFYVDEYDANGNWVSGKYIKGDNTTGSEELSVGYMPSSSNVKSVSLQVILPANSGITGYLDNVKWLAPSDSIVTPPAAPTNLVANGSFANGIADGWSTNTPSNVTADTSNNGDNSSSPEKAIKMVASTTGNAHLFSPKVTVDAAKSYSLTGYINLQQITSGELGYYIDEYDANGNWVSGQWKVGISSVGARDVAVSYTPSSANVKSASLQVYVTTNSGIIAYVDNIRWYQN
jgi:peptidoglycan/xylan/chitin deacetylase (PgdA/CDA1 family)